MKMYFYTKWMNNIANVRMWSLSTSIFLFKVEKMEGNLRIMIKLHHICNGLHIFFHFLFGPHHVTLLPNTFHAQTLFPGKWKTTNFMIEIKATFRTAIANSIIIQNVSNYNHHYTIVRGSKEVAYHSKPWV